MKLISTLTFVFILSYSFGQMTIQKIEREKFIGQKIKFLKDKDNVHGYQSFGKNVNAYPYLKYADYMGKVATFVEKNKDVYTLKLDDTGEVVYFKHYEFSEFPNNVGFLSLLDSAKAKYLNKTFYNDEKNVCKIVAIEFAEDDGQYSQLYGPYNVYYLVDKDTVMKNVHFTETYAPVKGYTYDHQKKNLFEVIFTDKNPFTPLTKSNIEEKFYIDIDKMENSKTYINKNLADNELIKYNLGYSINYRLKTLLTKVTVSSTGVPKISFISNYYGSEWLFHTYVKIKIGEETKQTTPVKGQTDVLKGGKVVETNYYSTPTDLAILKWIADNYSKEITVRLYGKDYYDDITLPMSVKLGIKETYDLFNLLKTK